MKILNDAESVSGITVPGVRGWTTTKVNGSFGLGGDESCWCEVMNRWAGAARRPCFTWRAAPCLSGAGSRQCPSQRHVAVGTGWLRQRGVDGHVTDVPGTALAVTVADCTPVFVAHPRAIALLHAGWRGTASQILRVGLEAMLALGCPANECEVHLGPSICGNCYEVGPEVFERHHRNRRLPPRGMLDVRAILSKQAASRWECVECRHEQLLHTLRQHSVSSAIAGMTRGGNWE